MRRVIVQYKLLPERVEENVRHVEAVYAQLAAERPGGLRYATFKLPDGVSFLHVASVESADGQNPLVALEAFRQFTASIAERCVEPPVSRELTEIGSYRFFGEAP